MSTHVVLEGLPGSGKTTLASLLAEDGYIKIDEMLVHIAEGSDEFAYVTQDVAKVQKRAQGDKTVMDRSFLSTLGYNYANDICSGAVNFPRIKHKVDEELASGNLKEPDLVIYLQVPLATSLARQNPENDAFWRSEAMLLHFEEYVLSYLRNSYRGSVEYIDGTQPPALVFRQAKQAINKLRGGA